MNEKVTDGRTYYSVDGKDWFETEEDAIAAVERAVSLAAAMLGAKGGRAGGTRKARSRKHYQEMLKKRWNK